MPGHVLDSTGPIREGSLPLWPFHPFYGEPMIIPSRVWSIFLGSALTLFSITASGQSLGTSGTSGFKSDSVSAHSSATLVDTDFCPLEPGTSYEYKGVMGRVLLQILDIKNGDASYQQIIHSIVPGGPAVIRSRGLFRVTNMGLFEIRLEGPNSGAEETRLRFPVKIGTTWSEPNPNVPGTQFPNKIAALGVTVRVPAGVFKNCVRVDHFNVDGTKAYSSWFAPHIGLVKDGVMGNLIHLTRNSKP